MCKKSTQRKRDNNSLSFYISFFFFFNHFFFLLFSFALIFFFFFSFTHIYIYTYTWICIYTFSAVVQVTNALYCHVHSITQPVNYYIPSCISYITWESDDTRIRNVYNFIKILNGILHLLTLKHTNTSEFYYKLHPSLKIFLIKIKY